VEDRAIVHDGTDPVFLIPMDLSSLPAYIMCPTGLVTIGIVAISLLTNMDSGMRLLLDEIKEAQPETDWAFMKFTLTTHFNSSFFAC
jgi:hypothetical protein